MNENRKQKENEIRQAKYNRISEETFQLPATRERFKTHSFRFEIPFFHVRFKFSVTNNPNICIKLYSAFFKLTLVIIINYIKVKSLKFIISQLRIAVAKKPTICFEITKYSAVVRYFL